MKKFKIGKRIIAADSIVDAVKISRMLDSPNTRVKSNDSWTEVYEKFIEISNKYLPNVSRINSEITKLYSSHIGEADWEEAYRKWHGRKSRDSEIDELTQEEQQAVEDYREAIRNTSNPKLLKIYSHILEEETEHLQELAQAKEIDDGCGKMKDSPVLGTIKQSAHIPVFTGYANKFLNGDESVKSQLENELKNIIQDLSYDTSNLPSQFKQEVKANYRSVRNICERLYREHKLDLAMRFMFMYDNRL